MPLYYGYSSYYSIGYLLVIIGMILMMYAQLKVSSNYSKYSKIQNRKNMTGAMVAREILDQNGLYEIEVNKVAGQLTDHYHPTKKVINLSQGIYDGTSIASLAVAAHECGHAIQHQQHYAPLVFRNSILPFCNVGQYLGWIAIFIGFLFDNPPVIWIGILGMCAILLFQVVTLPVEFDASRRALSILEQRYLASDEQVGAKKMLSAAAFTYVAAMISTVFSILRIVLIVLGNNRD